MTDIVHIKQKIKKEKDPCKLGVYLNELGICYHTRGEYQKAIDYFRKVLEIKRDLAEVYDNIANCYFQMREYKLSEINSMLSMKYNPNGKGASQLGFLMFCLKQFDQSIYYYNLHPEESIYTISFSYLAKKDYLTGFSLYQNRLRDNLIHPQTGLKERVEVPLPDWDGKLCDHLLVIYEQGIGDNIQYYRFILQVSTMFPTMKITYFCRDFLKNVFKQHPTIEIVHQLTGGYSCKVFIMSLPYFLKIDKIEPNKENYIRTNEEKCLEWKKKLPNTFKIGIFYKGLLQSHLEKSIPLQEFERFTEIGSLICLHRFNEIEEDVSKVSFRDKLFTFDIDHEPFEDTIAILKNIDVFITIDTSLAHLAGVLNIKTILLLGYFHDWRWFSTWYNSVEILKMKENKELKYILPEIKFKKTVTIPISIGELYDKYTILQIKKEKLKEDKLAFVQKELDYLEPWIQLYPTDCTELKKINELLWNIEDAIRLKETKNEFDQEFIELARSVYKTNDERYRLKTNIHLLYPTDIMEMKSY
jgi:tetratricopeptide (TPR) repeat protein